MMEAVRTSETSVDYYFTRQYIPEDNSEHEMQDKFTYCMIIPKKLTANYLILIIYLPSYTCVGYSFIFI
jgi:hypothetical protein